MVKIRGNISMTMKRDILIARLLPIFLGVALLTVYLLTMAPGLAWVNGGSDGGDLVTAAAVDGVAHPTGYPVYLILAKIFQMIPVGSLAYRTNLLSAVCMTLASLCLYAIVMRYLSSQGSLQSRFPSLLAGIDFGLAHLVWSQAVITEVYALHALLMSFMLYLLTKPGGPSPSLDRWLGICFGLAMGNHVTSILMFPVLIVNALFPKTILLRQRWNSLLRQLSWMVLGLMPYLVLSLRAAAFPPVNWGNPQTFDGLIWLVTGQLYRGQLFIDASSFLSRISAFAALLVENFALPGLYLGLLGVVYFFSPSRFYGNTIWAASAFSLFAVQYGTVDSNFYLIPAFLCFSAWIGVGVDGVFSLIGRQLLVGKTLLGTLIVLYLVVTAAFTLPKVDASHDTRADQFVDTVFSQAPEGAILFAKGDRAVFGLWYYHYALNERPDLFIIASDLLHFPWYLETVRATYPALNLSEPFPWTTTVIAENPNLPVCYVNYTNNAQVDCNDP